MLVRTSILPAIVVIWLLIGVLAAWQRDYFKNTHPGCASGLRIAATIVVGPLNYAGVNPKPDCAKIKVPQPSK